MKNSIACPGPHQKILEWLLLPIKGNRRAYQRLLEEHLKALAVLAIHAPADAGAREILETSEFVGDGR
ncbi:MAG: hypothetical protein AB4426_26265 [Xenococcaceae cyanobacterium]